MDRKKDEHEYIPPNAILVALNDCLYAANALTLDIFKVLSIYIIRDVPKKVYVYAHVLIGSFDSFFLRACD